MKKTTLAISIALLATTHVNATELKTTTQKASYALGTDLAKSFQQQGVEVDATALVAGMKDVLNKKKLQLSVTEMKQAVADVKKQVIEKELAKRKLAADANAKKGKAFLAKNKTKADIKTLENGLQYKVIETGKGPLATEDDHLIAHYKGSLIDGTVFDSSYSRGKPIEFQMDNVIRGWGEALKKMNPGSKWQIFVPANLAYGEKGAGKTIGPNETLIFDIELLTVSKNRTGE
jgi:FKBP-type peptidyl-prolyl cis-trans isomerase FklB